MTPVAAFHQLRHRRLPFWLDAALAVDGLGRYSFMGCEPTRVLARSADDAAALSDLEEATATTTYAPGAPGPCPAWVGYLGYDLRRLCERVPARAHGEPPLPALLMAHYPAVLRFDHEQRRALALGESETAVAQLLDRLQRPPLPAPPLPRLGSLRSDQAPAQYHAAVARILDYIVAGDVYEVCYSQRYRGTLEGDPAGLYLALRAAAPAPLGAYLDLGELQLLSNSPELFLRYEPTARRVESRPIKGTRPRGADPITDRRQQVALHADEKERAEHVMIVDLVRSDLGRVAAIGSVQVSGYGRNVALPTVHHRVSTVAARLREEVGLAALLRATFPGGSVTGAPKVRAMEIIDELEPCPRGPYCGALGYVGASGELCLAMAIRTAVVRRGALHLHTGGAVVADSSPQREHQEAVDKAAAFTQVVAALGSDPDHAARVILAR